MSIADKITRLKTARDNIRTALANYDIDASDHGYEDFADDIEGIVTFDPDDYAVDVIETTDESHTVYSREYKYIGKNVSKLSSGVYTNDNDVIEVQLPTSITQLSGSFNGCANLRSVNLQNITRLEKDSFRGCKSIRILYMPNLTYFHTYAFSPGTETTFALEEIYFPKMAEIGGLDLKEYTFFTKCPNLRLIDVSGAISIANGVFQNFKVGTNVINVILSENLKTLGQYVFQPSNSRMNVNGGTVYLPNLESAGRDCFSETLIEKIISLGKITDVPYNAFRNCKNLMFIRIPATVTSMQMTAFADNYMNRILIMEPVTPPSINGTFNNTYDIYVPDDSVEDYKAASNWSSAASKIHPMSEYTGTD